jgi:hypothetical protein
VGLQRFISKRVVNNSVFTVTVIKYRMRQEANDALAHCRLYLIYARLKTNPVHQVNSSTAGIILFLARGSSKLSLLWQATVRQ